MGRPKKVVEVDGVTTEVEDADAIDKGPVVSAPTVMVLITRGETVKIPDTVFDHELEILGAVHGLENVQTVEGTEGTAELPDDADAEIARLERKYIVKNQGNPVALYWNAATLGKSLGMAYARGGRLVQLQQSLQTSGKK